MYQYITEMIIYAKFLSLYGTSIRDTQFKALSKCTGPSQAYPAACIRSHVLDIDDAGTRKKERKPRVICPIFYLLACN